MTLSFEQYARVFQEMGYAGAEGTSLMARTKLLLSVKRIIQDKGWSQSEAASALGVKQPRISEIMRLRIDKFSVELLVRYLDRLGKSVELDIKDKPS